MKHSGKILFSSLKGGVGKSTAACCIAAALAGGGSKVTLADLDFRSGSLDILLGVSDRSLFNIDDYISGRCSAGDLTVEVPVGDGSILLCPAPGAAVLEMDMSEFFDKLPGALERLSEEIEADYFICDTGADSVVPKIVGDGFAEYAVVVCEQSRTSLRAAENTARRLSECGRIKTVRLLINNYDNDSARKCDRAGIIELIDGSATRCIGVIPHDPSLPSRQDRGLLPGRSSPVSTAARNTAERIKGEEVPLFRGMGRLRRKVKL